MSGSLPRRAVSKIRDEGIVSFLESTKRFAGRTLQTQLSSIKRKQYRLKYGSSYPETFQLIYADPADIEYYLLESNHTDWSMRETVNNDISHLYELDKGGFRRRKNVNTIVDGDWDKHRRPWDENVLYQSLRAVFVDGVDWEDTEFVQKRLEIIDITGDTYGCESHDEFLNKRVGYIEDLYHSMAENGYLTQRQAPKDSRNSDIFHEVSVNIGRNGELIFNNQSGHHRLSLAKILNIDAIPLLVVVRHKEWQEIREEIDTTNSIEDLCSSAKAHVEHPDTQDVASFC